MPVIIDGNNLLHSLPSREQNRDSVRRRALDTVRHGGMSLTVVFDGPPPVGSPDPEHLGRLTIRYSGASSADDLILRLLPKAGRASEWVVITDDRALRGRVSEQGAQVRTLQEWQSRRPRKPRREPREPKLSSREVTDWETFFSSREDDAND
ncbi:MAG: NYN domain-containing protein, partial [Acidobacteria bacterium]|nr:NYN domain-containing protein [Candidatus Sulfomarinibacter kjeldsenii]MBD3855501.1 NYN domain-containing protein [Candidatus Sulfomarinibacter kjeldsenii]